MGLLLEVADRLRITPAEARAVRAAERAKSAQIAKLESRLAELSRTVESTEIMDRLIDPFERYIDAQGRLWTPAGTIQDRRHGRSWPTLVTELDLRQFRAWSRLLCDANIIAMSFLDRLVEFGVGDGYLWNVSLKGPNPGPTGSGGRENVPEVVKRVQAVLDEWRIVNDWSAGPWVANPGNPDDDTGLIQNREEEAFRRWRRDGEVFLRFFKGNSSTNWQPIVRWIEPEQIGTPPDKSQDSDWSWGIRNAASDSERIEAYYVREMDADGTEGETVPGGRVVHLKANVDAAIKRGIPDFAPLHDDLERCRKLLRNMGEVSAILAAIAYLRQHAPGVTQTQVQSMIGQGTDANLPRLRAGILGSQYATIPTQYQDPGTIHDLSNGQNYVAPPMQSGAPGFIAVEQAILRAAGARWGMPEFFSGDASNNNFASISVTGGPFERATKSRQKRYAMFQQAIASKVLAFAVQSGRLSEADMRTVEVKVVPPGVSVTDALADEQIRQIRKGNGVLSVQTWQAEVGLDPAQEAANIKSHNEQFPDPTGGMGGGDLGGLGGFGESLEIFLEDGQGFTGDMTDSMGRKRHYVNGRQVASPGGKGDPSGDPKGPSRHVRAQADQIAADVADGIADKFPAVKSDPTLLAKVKGVAAGVALKVIDFAVRATPHIAAAIPEIADTAEDYMNIKYAKNSGYDALMNSTGVPTNVAIAVASHVLSRAVVFARHRLGEVAVENAATPEQIANAVADMIEAIHAGLGADAPDRKDILAFVQQRAKK